MRSLAILAALALSALAPRPLLADGSPRAPQPTVSTCTIASGQSGGADTLTLEGGSRVIQPLPDVGSLVWIEPKFFATSYNTTAAMDLIEWDPLLLFPDAGATALRSWTYDVSELQMRMTRETLYPPVVTRSLPHVADPPLRTLAYRWRNGPAFQLAPQWLEYSSTGDPSYPVARVSPAAAPYPYQPLAGAHPVLDHALCRGDAGEQSLVVAQAVRRADSEVGPVFGVVAQRFRLPGPVRLSYVELRLAPYDNTWPYLPGTIEIHDASGASEPPATFGTPIASADFPTDYTPDRVWRSNVAFAEPPLLAADQDYWLVVRTQHECALSTRTLDGSQSLDFATRIGPFYAHDDHLPTWSALPDRALCFQIVGTPADPVGAPPAAPAAFALRVSPNPMRGRAQLSWSGATGRVRFEVLDPRGRRVGGGEAAASAGWTWDAVDESGTPLAAGVYFVRATDEAGRSGRERVVVVR